MNPAVPVFERQQQFAVVAATVSATGSRSREDEIIITYQCQKILVEHGSTQEGYT
jgi:hypothetical protein